MRESCKVNGGASNWRTKSSTWLYNMKKTQRNKYFRFQKKYSISVSSFKFLHYIVDNIFLCIKKIKETCPLFHHKSDIYRKNKCGAAQHACQLMDGWLKTPMHIGIKDQLERITLYQLIPPLTPAAAGSAAT